MIVSDYNAVIKKRQCSRIDSETEKTLYVLAICAIFSHCENIAQIARTYRKISASAEGARTAC